MTPSSAAWNGLAKLVRNSGIWPFTLVPGQPWQEIRGLGNRLRHEYDAIREDRIWNIVTINIPTLRVACVEALTRLRG